MYDQRQWTIWEDPLSTDESCRTCVLVVWFNSSNLDPFIACDAVNINILSSPRIFPWFKIGYIDLNH